MEHDENSEGVSGGDGDCIEVVHYSPDFGAAKSCIEDMFTTSISGTISVLIIACLPCEYHIGINSGTAGIKGVVTSVTSSVVEKQKLRIVIELSIKSSKESTELVSLLKSGNKVVEVG
jgi:hypothetical protein